jgi:superfamily II DNA or RNA helicase
MDVSLSNDARQKLVATYEKLSTIEQWVVQLASVIYAPTNRTALIQLLTHVGIHDKGGKPFTNSSFKTVCESLIAKQLLVQADNKGPQCHPLIAEIATRHAIRLDRYEDLVKAVEAKLPLREMYRGGPAYFTSEFELIREVRIGLYRGDVAYINKQVEAYSRSNYSGEVDVAEIYQFICNNPFDPDWMRTLTPEIRTLACSSILDDALLILAPAGPVWEFLIEETAQSQRPDNMQQILLVEQLIFRGQFQEAKQQIQRVSDPQRHQAEAYAAMITFLQGDTEAAIAQFTQALTLLRKSSGKRKAYFQSIPGLFFILALLDNQASGAGAPRLAEALIHAQSMRQTRHWLAPIYNLLALLIQVQQGDLNKKRELIFEVGGSSNSLEMLFGAYCRYWVEPKQPPQSTLPQALASYRQQAIAGGFTWLAMEASELLTRVRPQTAKASDTKTPGQRRAPAKGMAKQGRRSTAAEGANSVAALEQARWDEVPVDEASAWRKQQGVRTLVDLLKAQEAWELCLTALTNLSAPVGVVAAPANSQRMVWLVTYSTGREGSGHCHIEPREQKINAQGAWSRGRAVALKRLKKAGELPYLTPQDLQVCAHLEAETSYSYYGYYSSDNYVFGEKTILALVGHPLVFWADGSTRIDIVKGEPELLVQKNSDESLSLQLMPDLSKTQSLMVTKESPTRLKVIEVTPQHRRIAEVLGAKNRLDVPAVAKERVLSAINAIAAIVTVHSDIGGGGGNVEAVPADAKPHVHLLPSGGGLKVAVLARPFAEDGPYYPPGTGGETVIAEIGGKRLQTLRNLKLEKQLAKAAITACPTLAETPADDGEWQVEDPEACLELLTELQELHDSVVLEWPEGEKMRISHHGGFDNLKLKIQRQNDWFETTGELQLDDSMVLDIQRLMELMAGASGRFVPLGDGQFLALTDEFRKRMEELRAFSEKSGKGRRLNPLAALTLEDWIDEVGELKADKHWKSHIQRLKEAQALEPKLPSTLQAELRDYQVEGFNWLMQLAHWGVGACLADDMGLGKTLQALALILTRAPEGPTLVIAPTSVGMNWISEAQRFAPTLNPIQFATTNRQQLLDDLQPFDFLICSYGLLQQEEVAEMLAKVQWKTIVLDEAQSIKNFATKRSQAAMNLQGDFKIITTGTPIENHLGELWNLFRFINPGLLGSLESFNQRFAGPIERYGNTAVRNQLKRLVQPFMLRRTKNQVLSELPSRTEIVLQVELSKEEMAFYEALRREAMAKLSDSDAKAGVKHLQVLAEIMRLRRACCNPKLVAPELGLPSAKLQLFGEVLTELLENKHKALVFSQFVDHLTILRQYLDEQKITYQYLDGSTPVAQRKKQVQAFQAGEGDVFLISLKAGGTGLNLTAADYVIHMDPWWNPAVEDQASDRAHRMGQKRPVTIYRLVAKNTIEEKIVELHHQKRDLADSLLEGAEISGKISTDDLLRLIQEV